jgi:ATP-dependent DNA helicase RecG
MGTQQSGILDLKIADIAKDHQVIVLARNSAIQLLQNDPSISEPKNLSIRNVISKKLKSKPNWGQIA